MTERYVASVTEQEAMESLARKRKEILDTARDRRGLPPRSSVRYDPGCREFVVDVPPPPPPGCPGPV